MVRRIDVHHHISPPTWLEAVKKANLDFPPSVNWSAQRSIEDMEQGGVSTSIVSPTMPHVAFLAPEHAMRFAREFNEYAKRLAVDYPGRFGVFAILPMPHIDESLKEIEYAFDELKVDGVAMMTSYGDKWLGYPKFATVFEALHRRKANVQVHPNRSNAVHVHGIPPSVIEFGVDTTRAIANLIFSGASMRYSDVNFIFSHGGGVLTSVVERFQDFMVRRPEYQDKFTRQTVEAELRRFYYDTAQIANSVTIKALAKLIPVSQIVFGSDYPFRTASEHVKGLAVNFSDPDLKAIACENALRLLPRL